MNAELARVRSEFSKLRFTIRGLFVFDYLARVFVFLSIAAVITFVLDYALILPQAIRLGFLLGDVGASVYLLLSGLAGGAVGFLAGAAILATAWALYRFHVLKRGVFVFIAFGIVGVVAYLTWTRLIKFLGILVSDDDLALFIERRYPELNSRLISALQLSRTRGENPGFNSPELIDALVQDAGNAVRTVKFDSILAPGRVMGPFMLALAGVALLAGLAVAFPAYSSIYLQRIIGINARWPKLTDLRVLGFENGTMLVAKGDNVKVVVEPRGVQPNKVLIHYRFENNEGGTDIMGAVGVYTCEACGKEARREGVCQEEACKKANKRTRLAGSRFEFTFSQVITPFSFYVSTRDVETDRYTVKVLNPPEIRDLQLYFRHPAYLKSEDTPADRPVVDPNIQVPKFTEVTVHAICTEELSEAELLYGLKGKEERRPAQVIEDSHGLRVARATFVVDKDLSEYSMRVRARNGLWNRDPQRYQIKGVDDKAPEFDIREPKAGNDITRECIHPVFMRVTDDHGVKSVWMKITLNAGGKKVQVPDVKFEGPHLIGAYGDKSITINYNLEFEKLHLSEKDQVEVQFFAQDFKDIDKPNIRESKVYTFRIVSVVELEKSLEGQIERIREELRRLAGRQSSLINRTHFLSNKYKSKDRLTPEESGEIRAHSIEQNDITVKIEKVANEIQVVRDRGKYNRIFDDKSAGALTEAVQILRSVSSAQATTAGASWTASQRLLDAARSQRDADRQDYFSKGRQSQVETHDALWAAIRKLEQWATFQDFVRIAREAYEAEKDVKKKADERARCRGCLRKSCPTHR